MLSIVCDRCGGCLDKPGGLVFGPPDSSNRSVKHHFCVGCYDSLLDWIELGGPNDEPDDDPPPPPKSSLAQERKAYELEDKMRCPKCQSAMKLRTNRNTGTPFFGCIDFPDCKGTREADGSVGVTTRKNTPLPSFRGYDTSDDDNFFSDDSDIPF